jgi:hypothetical protein
MRALRKPAAEAGIAIPRIRESDLGADPAWVIFEALSGVPVPEAGDAGLEGPGFPELARAMGELLASFRRLPTAGLELDDLWAEPWAPRRSRGALGHRDPRAGRYGAGGAGRSPRSPACPLREAPCGTGSRRLRAGERVNRRRVADRAARLRIGAPGRSALRRGRWAWAVGFSSPAVLEAAWPGFLQGAGIDASDPELLDRVRSLQVLRMLELLVGETSLGPDVQRIVADRLRAMLR